MYHIPLSHLRSKGKASAYILYCTGSGMLTRYVTESTKTGLIAYRQVLRKAGFNYLKCCSSPMAEATSIEFSHTLYNNALPLKPSSSQIDKKQVSRHFR